MSKNDIICLVGTAILFIGLIAFWFVSPTYAEKQARAIEYPLFQSANQTELKLGETGKYEINPQEELLEKNPVVRFLIGY